VVGPEKREVSHFGSAEPVAEEVEVVGFGGSKGGEEDGLGELVVCLFVSDLAFDLLI
jgi:hypothetical protein